MTVPVNPTANAVTQPVEAAQGDAEAEAPSAAALVHIADALASALSSSREVIDLVVTTFAAGGHLLLEDVPGVGKTTLARAMGQAIGGRARRIQFTPDLLPSDLTGVSIYSRDSHEFEFHPGPLFANIVIADEINRANPKTQSAMLEAMSEGQISVDGNTHTLPNPYLVIATQNPIELEGTYPLPEAQLDRFMTCSSFGYPSAKAEAAMLTATDWSNPLERVAQICSAEEAGRLRDAVRTVVIADAVADYIVALTRATRIREDVRYGASPRASLHLAAMARARAFINGRDYVLPDDVQTLAVPVLAHRLVLDDAGFGSSDLEHARQIIADIVSSTPVPRA
ncbi:MoxR family ATPase [Bifidobacterium imperatoris]|uniref:MoxR family ATPase n=1 Tax=Bifidobacterium imperatoris TaxID=2020965 RepID=A0A2N5IT11_9BIFI|nr:MoxR family ATPase [Bifidobacterium imperatoris]PLS25098.1 MoxR-like ATPase [Bifidobacterium imperatoris]QSY56765.1 MoxR family ATPase [Bifidobacterium imperatoris]